MLFGVVVGSLEGGILEEGKLEEGMVDVGIVDELLPPPPPLVPELVPLVPALPTASSPAPWESANELLPSTNREVAKA